VMDKVFLEVEQSLQAVCLAGVLVPQRLLKLKLLILLPQSFVLFVNGVKIDVSAPEAANGVSAADNAALEWTEHGDGPHSDEADGAAIGVVGVCRALDLGGKSDDLRKQCPGKHNGVAVPSEESFCRASVFGGHDTMEPQRGRTHCGQASS
jgi:hypothetical protein